jgi:hypothetical protein
MANSEFSPFDEPGKRTGEGSKSILPHLQRQQQTQLKQKLPKPTTQPDADGPESVPPTNRP